MKYLVLESSAAAASCALLEGDKVLGEWYLNIPQTHSQTLLPMAEGLLAACGASPAGLDFFAVTRGPGSFTGLRIAMAAVKGMACLLYTSGNGLLGDEVDGLGAGLKGVHPAGVPHLGEGEGIDAVGGDGVAELADGDAGQVIACLLYTSWNWR